jgi:hypothetical protein
MLYWALVFLVVAIIAGEGCFAGHAEQAPASNLKTDPLKRFSASAGPCSHQGHVVRRNFYGEPKPD